jgi:hypothetical protein
MTQSREWASVIEPLAILTMLALLSMAATEPKSTVPDAAALRARVAHLAEAYRTGKPESIEPFVLPQFLICSKSSDDEPEDPGEKDARRMLSWKIRRIQYDAHYVGQAVELCPGQTFRATAGALVVVSQTEQSTGSKPEIGDVGLRWVYVDGVWYTLLQDD